MIRAIRLLRSRRGETLVEVMVSMVLFLMALGVLSGAMQFAAYAQRKAMEIRDYAAAVQAAVRSAHDAEVTGTGQYVFHDEGGTVTFQVDVQLMETDIADADGSRLTFHSFGTDLSGGGSP